MTTIFTCGSWNLYVEHPAVSTIPQTDQFAWCAICEAEHAAGTFRRTSPAFTNAQHYLMALELEGRRVDMTFGSVADFLATLYGYQPQTNDVLATFASIAIIAFERGTSLPGAMRSLS